MIQTQTMLDVADNSGAKRVMCIRVLGIAPAARRPGGYDCGHDHGSGPGGDGQEGDRGQGGDRSRLAKATRRNDGSYIRFDGNAAVLINAQGRADRDAHLRSRGPGASLEELHEDRLACAGGSVGCRGFSSGVARAHVRKDDTVLVRRGRDRGRRGKVLTVLLKTGQVFVEKLNLVKRHTKPNPRTSRGNHRERGADCSLERDARLPQVQQGGALREEGPSRPADAYGCARTAARRSIGVDEREGTREITVRLREHYGKEVVSALMKRFGYTNRMQVPRLEKIILNVGLGEATQDAKLLDAVVKEIATITGQRPVVTRAKKSIAGFKLREGMPVGCMVTLRRERMYEFFDRLVNAALPQIRDFQRHLAQGIRRPGELLPGDPEQFIFPEIEYDKVEKVHGMDVVIVTTARTNEEGKTLLSEMGMLFRELTVREVLTGMPSVRDRKAVDIELLDWEEPRVAKKSLIAKAQRTPKFPVRAYHRCRLCGRPRAYLRKFGMCRICFRSHALKGDIPGVIKASW